MQDRNGIAKEGLLFKKPSSEFRNKRTFYTSKMNKQKHIITTGNQAVANIAYKTNGVFAIYPITPASEMSELVEEWSAKKQQNIFGNIPSIFQMQSEAGVAGTMHGALQTGSLSTTFTASQGLLLMIPNMYKIAGELTPNVIHVATRSVATHALSVFGDHSDIMAVRNTGYAMLGAASVQEAQDFALIAQASTLKSKIPFVHFFDGFRTSHETSKIELIPDGVIQFMMYLNDIETHRKRALNPNAPVLRGTSQGPDVFFQSKEATNLFYKACPEIVQDKMNTFATLTGRHYKLFDFVGDPKAEYVIVSMASSTETIEQSVKHLNEKGEKIGLIKVRLFRPFSTTHLLKALPKTVKAIAVLDRTKEPGATGEPLYLDVVQSISEAFQNKNISAFPRIVGGRYGLSSKEFTPTMVNAIFNNLKIEQPKQNFTIGINDDVTNLSLNLPEVLDIEGSTHQTIIYQSKTKQFTDSINNVLHLVGNTSNTFIQSYTECTYNKTSNFLHKTHLRIDNKTIKAPYLITNADMIVCQNALPLENDDILNLLKPNGTLLVNTSLTTHLFWQTLSATLQNQIIVNDIQLYIVNIHGLKEHYTINNHVISGLHTCFLSLKNELSDFENKSEINQAIHKVNSQTGNNIEMQSLNNIDNFSETLLGKLLANKGNEVSVGMLPFDGTYPSNTSQYNAVQNVNSLPKWQPNACIQCGACSMACPQGALRIKAFEESFLNTAPNSFKSIKSIEPSWELDLLNYTIQIHPEQCTSCNHCIDACPTKALNMANKSSILKEAKENWAYFETIPEFDRTKIDVTKVSQQQLQEPLFKYGLGENGCGEAPYLKLLSQLFGDRLLVANATGSSSIIGGAIPTTPWSKNSEGKGPSWSNSLFEDNAEFGFGFRMSLDHQEKQACRLLELLLPDLDFQLVYDILKAKQTTELEIIMQRKRVEILKQELAKLNSDKAKQLHNMAESLIKKSVWIVGGDGWAYDIGYGGIDHVISSGKNVNILVLDNEAYDNTGGQTSKATPFGAEAKFSFNGKQKKKKDLGQLMMNYENVYVASVVIGADQEQTLKAFNEAESFDGPSIIIAYCHSNAHGIDMKTPSQYHKAAVLSGQWPLYRHDPRRLENGLSAFQLDSNKPSLKIENYLKMEKRFNKALQNKSANVWIDKAQSEIYKRYQYYVSKSSTEIQNSVII